MWWLPLKQGHSLILDNGNAYGPLHKYYEGQVLGQTIRVANQSYSGRNLASYLGPFQLLYIMLVWNTPWCDGLASLILVIYRCPTYICFSPNGISRVNCRQLEMPTLTAHHYFPLGFKWGLTATRPLARSWSLSEFNSWSSWQVEQHKTRLRQSGYKGFHASIAPVLVLR